MPMVRFPNTKIKLENDRLVLNIKKRILSSKKNIMNYSYHRRTGTIFLGGLKLFCPNVTSPKRT